MKTIVRNDTNMSLYIFEDNKVVDIDDEKTQIGVEDDPSDESSVVWDCNSSNVTLHENIDDTPENWSEWRYTYDGSSWAVNPDWVASEWGYEE